MNLVERHIIKRNNPIYDELDKMCLASKNLYNQTLYRIRQHFFNEKKYLNRYQLINELTSEQQVDYIALPRKVSQWVINQVDNNFKSFFGSLNSKRNGSNNRKVKIPKYIAKDGRNMLTFTNQAISIKYLKNGKLKLSGCENTINVIHRNIQQVRVIPKGEHYIIEIIYKTVEKPFTDNGNYVGIDLGLNNLATIGGNDGNTFIINGKPLKSINQYFNKKLSKLKSRSDKCKNKNVNKRLITHLYEKRNNKVKDYMHKASRMLVNQLVSNNVSIVVIGHNKGWKQDSNIGKTNNQNFVQIPFDMFIKMIEYKCQLEGIKVIIREESYTSKCSFYDNEEICKHDIYIGRRVKRGLFKTGNGKMVNADLNGALNILKKEIPNAFCKEYGIEVCSTPIVLTMK